MKKGFTLVEMLGVIAILAILALLATPAYVYIRDSINNTMYENKVKLILAAAEAWASETGYDSVNIGHLIEEGKIEADNELGDYKNPITGDSLLCNVIRIDYDNNQYIGRFTEEQVCDYDELVVQSSIIIFNKYTEDGELLKDGEWTNGNIVLKVELKEGYTGLAGNITHLQIRGNNQTLDYDLNQNFAEKNVVNVQANQILKTEYEARITVVENGITKEYRAKTEVRIDKQRPIVYTDEVSIKNEDSWTSGGKNVTFTMSDGSGSGIFGYAVVQDPDCTKATYTQTDKTKITKEFGAGVHYICVKDNAGNLSEDVSTQTFEVSKIDNNPPKIDSNNGVNVSSKGNGFNSNQVTIKIDATDETDMSMCISNTGFEQDCVWEKYSPTKDWTISDTLDGKEHTVYITLRDQAGNKTNVQSNPYKVYLECSQSTKGYTENWGSCSVKCGGGVQYRPYQVKDNHTGKVCSAGSDVQSCNTQPCDTTPPKIDPNTGLQISSNGSGFNSTSVTLKITATDESEMMMCISNTGFEQGCVWEKYTPTKNWTISSSFDGKDHYVYVTVRDEAGNKTNIQSKAYRVYGECSQTTKTYTSDWGTCSATCDGVQYRSYQAKDKYTGKVCSSGTDSQSCNPCHVSYDYNLYIYSDSMESSREFYLGELGTYKVRVYGEMVPWCYWNDSDKYRCLSTTFRMRYTTNADSSYCEKWTSKTILTKSTEAVNGWYVFDETYTIRAEAICFQYGNASAPESAFNNYPDSGVNWSFTYELQ